MTSRLTRLALGAGIGLAGGVLGVVALSSAAHADDGTAQRPGGALGAVVGLPAQAADRAQDVVGKVAPRPAKPADKPKPTKDPKPTHAPTAPAEDEPSDEPVEVPPVVVDPPPVVADPPVVIDPAPVTTPPVVIEPAPTVPTPTLPPPLPTPTLPIQDPPTIPAAPVTLPTIPVPAVQPVALPAVTPPLPPALAALLGPTAAPGTPTPALTDDDPLVPALIASLIGAADCYAPLNNPHDATDGKTPSGGEQRADRVQQQHSLGQPCPGHPGAPDTQAITTLAVKPPPPDGQQLVADSAAGTYSPALQRLSTLRPRGDLPAGRWPLVEPGPA